MAFTTFSGPVRTGTVKDTTGELVLLTVLATDKQALLKLMMLLQK